MPLMYTYLLKKNAQAVPTMCIYVSEKKKKVHVVINYDHSGLEIIPFLE